MKRRNFLGVLAAAPLCSVGNLAMGNDHAEPVGMPAQLGLTIDPVCPWDVKRQGVDIQLNPAARPSSATRAYGRATVVDNINTVEKILNVDSGMELYGGLIKGRTTFHHYQRTDSRKLEILVYYRKAFTERLSVEELDSIGSDSAADDYFTKSPLFFAARYGTHVVTSITRQAIICVRYEFQTSTTEKRNKLRQEIEANFLKISGKTDLEAVCKKVDSTTRISISMHQVGAPKENGVEAVFNADPGNVSELFKTMAVVIGAIDETRCPVTSFEPGFCLGKVYKPDSSPILPMGLAASKQNRFRQIETAFRELNWRVKIAKTLQTMAESSPTSMTVSSATIESELERMNSQFLALQAEFVRVWRSPSVDQLNARGAFQLQCSTATELASRVKNSAWLKQSHRKQFSYTSVNNETPDSGHGGRLLFHACVWPNLSFPALSMLDLIEVSVERNGSAIKTTLLNREMIEEAISKSRQSSVGGDYLAKPTHRFLQFPRTYHFKGGDQARRIFDSEVFQRVNSEECLWRITVVDIAGGRHEIQWKENIAELVFRDHNGCQDWLGRAASAGH